MTDCGLNADWKGELVSVAQDFVSPVTSHPIRESLNFSRFLAIGDAMHSGPLGVLAWLLGGIFLELIFDGTLRGTIDTRLQAMWDEIVGLYEELGLRNRIGGCLLYTSPSPRDLH